jgi:acetamidase/formamidase
MGPPAMAVLVKAMRAMLNRGMRYSNEYAFAALKADGSITAWGNSNNRGMRIKLALKDIRFILNATFI